VSVTVAIPVLNGGARLGEVLDAVRAQEVDADVEVLVCDSGSTDGSDRIARARGATVLHIRREEFSHGGTRNLLMQHAGGTHVAFLTQDAVPADEQWLHALLAGFEAAPDVALSYGPYRARDGAPLRVRRELDDWFRSFAPDGQPRIDRLDTSSLPPAPSELLGPRGFFTDANGCVSRAAWQRVPFRAHYAEDHQLALDMLYAGYAKTYVPQAAVVHSHEYSLPAELRRAFDEWRGLSEVYGYVEPITVAAVRRRVIGPTRQDLRQRWSGGCAGAALLAAAVADAAHHAARFAGSLLGSRAARLRPSVRRWISLERRASFVPAHPPNPRI
jgi:rhamnosyltransferase